MRTLYKPIFQNPSIQLFGQKIGWSYTQAMNTQLLDQARKLSVDEQIELVEALWDSIENSLLATRQSA